MMSKLENSNAVGQNQSKKALPGLPQAIKEKFLAAAAAALPSNSNDNFAYSHTYAIDAAPNPGLNVDGLGPIELPSSQRGARYIVKSLKQASDTGDSAPEASFEWPSLLVLFDNPEWEGWVQRNLLPDVCAALDVQDVAKHRCQLENLSLLMEGSSETFHHSKDRHGSIIVILPCPFSGGIIQASTRDQVKTFDLATDSARSISVVANLPGVECKIGPVTSGHQLALHYSLQPLHDAGSFPQVPRLPEAASSLRSTLLAWKQSETEEKPTALLAYLLQGTISQPAQAGSQFLSGFDSSFLQCLLSSAGELDFEIYIASARLKISGETGLLPTAKMCTDPKCIDPIDGPDCCQVKVTDLEPDKCATTSLVVQDFVDAKGMPVEFSELDVKQEDIINPESWQSGTPDIRQMVLIEPEFVDYEYHYERAILLVWPKSAERSVRIGDVYDYTCNALRKSTSLVASPEENHLIDLLLQCCRERQDDKDAYRFRLDMKKTIGERLTIAMRVLYDTAKRWEVIDVFKRAVDACPAKGRVTLVGVDIFIAAIWAFDWTTTKDILALALADEEDDTCRRELISQITKLGKEWDDDEMKQWCKEQNESVIQSLKDVGLNQVDWLLSLVKERGAEHFRDVLLPQLLVQNPITDFWLSFVQQLHELKDTIPSSTPSLIDTIISQCIHRAAETCVPFGSRRVKTSGTTITDNQELFMAVIELCVNTNNVETCTALFQHMDSVRRLSTQSRYNIERVYKEETSKLDHYLRAKPELDAFSHVFRVFFESAAAMMIREMPDCTGPEILKVMANRIGGPEQVFAKCAEAEALHPILKGKDTQYLRKTLLLISSISGSAAKDQDDDGFKHTCSVAFIDSIDMRSLHKRNSPSCPDNGAQILMNEWHICVKNGMHAALRHLPRRLLSLLDGPDGETQFDDLLMPLLVCLRRALEKRKMTLTDVTYYVELCVGMARYYANTLSIQTNPTRAASPGLFGCVCQECDALKKFLCSSEQSVVYELSKSTRSHMVSQLSKAKIALSNVRWTLRQQNQGPALEVCKPPSSTLSGFDSDGLEFLSRLGGTAIQKRILGADYNRMFAAIVGKPPSLPEKHGGTGPVAGQKRPVGPESQAMNTGFSALPKKPKFV